MSIATNLLEEKEDSEIQSPIGNKSKICDLFKDAYDAKLDYEYPEFAETRFAC